jgi:pyrroloquinoline quinone biosynthesis protein B
VARLLGLGVLACASLQAQGRVEPAARGDWTLVVLGVAQDGGMPHIGCRRAPCAEARAGVRRAEKVASLGVVDRASGAAYLFDATPDLPAQLHALTGGAPPLGIFLTHAHAGHYTGLMYLGKEALAARSVPVHCTPRMRDFLSANAPWSLLVSGGHVEPRALELDRGLELPGGLRVTAFRVPHREELSDAVGYRIDGPRGSALFVPDIDRWEAWDRSIRELAGQVDLAFLDGTFSSPAELSHRPLSEIPHPMIPETRRLLRGVRARTFFIHLNHSNPEWSSGASDVAREGMEFPL